MRRVAIPPDPPVMSNEDRINALRSELLLIKPYASTKGLVKLRQRVNELYSAIHRLTGLPLDDAP